MKNAIEIRGLKKVYVADGKEPEKTALHGIDLDIPKGSIFGLLGPNGAGKSTIINTMAGLVMKTEGSVFIWGMDIDKNPRNTKTAIGIVPQEINFDPFFTSHQILENQAGFYGVPKSERWTDDLLEMVDLTDKADAYSRSLSGGMKRRLMVAKALVHKPPILVLDEPTAGVDVELRKMLWENVRKLNREGVTILLTTHYLEEAEELCDQIAIINYGQIVANDDKENLLGRIESKEVRFRFEKEIQDIPICLTQYNVKKEGQRTLALRYTPKDQYIDEILKIVQTIDNPIIDITTDDSDLEDIFLQITQNS